MSDRTSDQKLHVCPDCKCQFVQPFVCITCGAENLYDATVRGQAETIERLRTILRGIASCSTCEMCRDAALSVVGTAKQASTAQGDVT